MEPTLYEYYTSEEIQEGLSDKQPYFTLNKRKITIYSGALHYFRVPPAYWRDRLRKMRAVGLNAVETYVPWNLHEPQPGLFDFGNGSTDFTKFLNLERFLKLAQEEDLFVILRPGPYICAEWDFGGLPSWILRLNTKIRTCDPNFINLVKRYFSILLAKLCALQFINGGPIIAVQIENEYGNTKEENQPIDTEYLSLLKEIILENGIVELLFTSDTPSNGFFGTLPGVLATANFQDQADLELSLLKKYQPNKPLMVMEYWTGWFDHWAERHHTRSSETFGKVLEDILSFGASVNMYMFHGGTNWGFLNGANIKGISTDNSAYQPDVTSYDYDAPLDEGGDYTDKYYKVKELIKKYNTVVTKLPDLPRPNIKIAYPTITIKNMLTVDDLIQQSCEIFISEKPIAMESLNINNNSGQSYGYIVYRKKNISIPPNSILKIEGHVCDTVLVLLDGDLKSKIVKSKEDLNGFGYWRLKDSEIPLGEKGYLNATLDLVVENFGRVNYGKLHQFNQYKGLWQGNILLNDSIVGQWDIAPLQFQKCWTNSLINWKPIEIFSGPALYKATFETMELSDCFIDMREWQKGFVIINGFVLGRYFKLGPQQTLYLPAPFLNKGLNTILIFEHFRSAPDIKFCTNHIFEEAIN